jgi:hypothetical protein
VVRTRWETLALGGLVAATLGACGGGGEDACPTGAPVVELVGFEWSPMPGEEHLPEANLLEHVVDLRFEVTNDTAAPIEVQSVDLVVGLENEAIDWRRDAPRVAAGDTAALDAQVVALFQAVNAREPSAQQIDVEWRWDGPEQRDCTTPRARVEPTAGDDPAPTTATPIPTMPAPQAPPDALAIGDTATFALPSGQEVRLTVTSASTTGTCPEPAAPPPSVGHLFVGLRLEVGPGSEPWRIHATSMNVGPAAAPSVTDAAGPCVGASGGHNNLQAGPGQTAEATFVFDGLGPAIWYTFDAYGLAEPQQVAWAT